MNRTVKRISKIVLWCIGSVLMLLVLVVLLIRLPAVQNYLAGKVVNFVSSKTHTRIELKRLFIAFPKSVVIEQLYAEDVKHDTLLYVQKLKVDINMFVLLHKKVKLNNVLLSGAVANIERNSADSSFNFDFLINAFGKKEQQKEAEKSSKADTSAGWQVEVDKLAIENVKGGFADGVGGTAIHGYIGRLDLNMKAMDISRLSFNANELSLSNTEVKMVQNKEGAEKPDTGIFLMPLLSLNKLQLNKVNFSFQNNVNGQLYAIHAGDVSILPELIDLNNRTIKVKDVDIAETSVAVALAKDTMPAADGKTPDSTNTEKGWEVAAGQLTVKAVDFSLDITNAPHQPGGVDYNHMDLKNIQVDVKNAFYSPEKISAHIKNLALQEKSGFVLKRLTANAVYGQHHAQLENLLLVTNNTQIGNSLQITYPSISSLAKDISVLGVDADFRNTHIAVEDILLFAPQLKNQPVLARNSHRVISLSGKLSGKVKNITATDFLVSTADTTLIVLNAHITGLPDAAHAFYDVELKQFNTSRSDVSQLADTLIPSSINIPDNVSLNGKFKGSLLDFTSHLLLQTTSGDVEAEMEMKRVNADTQYVASLQTRALDIGYILQKKDLLGPVTLTAHAGGKNFSPSVILANADVNIQSAVFNKHNYHQIALSASAGHNVYKTDLTVKDTSLRMDMQAEFSLAEKQEFIKANLHVEGADWQQLNFAKEDLRTSGYLSADLTGNLQNLNGNASLHDIVIIKNGEKYRVDSVLALSVNDGKHSAFSVKSAIVNADYDGTVKFSSLGSSLINHFNRYFKITDKETLASKNANDTSSQNFKLTVNVEPHPVIAGVLLPKLEKFNGAEITSEFDNSNHSFKLSAFVSSFAYGGSRADNIKANINSNENELAYSISVDSAKSGPARLSETSFSGSVSNNVIQFGFKVHDKDSADKLLISGDFKRGLQKNKEYFLHLDNKGLVIANEKWQLPNDNYIRFGAGGFFINNLVLSNNAQMLSAKSSSTKELEITFNKFRLGTLSQIIESDTALVRGTLDGTIELRNLQTAPAFISNLQMDNIIYKEAPIGNIHLQADNLTDSKYSVQMALSGYENKMEVKGFYSPSAHTNQLAFNADIQKLNLSTIEPFTAGQLRRSSGYLQGQLSVNGTISKPAISGYVDFKNAAFNLTYINNYLVLKDERVTIDPKGIYFRSFDILDTLGQKASIQRAVYTTDFRKMKFDVVIRTDHFMVLNTTIRDNPLYFGKVILTSNISVKGDESLPVVKASAKLLDGTHIAVVIPSGKISTDRGEGVVRLVDTVSAENDIMEVSDTISVMPQFEGINLTANVEITGQTTFKLIVDKISGDSLVVRGDGLLSFNMNEGGGQSLTGTYTLSGGSYKATFQKIIKRELKIQPGGTITWNGTPTDAVIDITAVYSVRTPPVDLLASELAGSTTSERNVYRKPMNFKVLMNMKGRLLKPEISFKLDMNEADQNAFGGVVYSKINSLNNDPSELNKQVFALLVLNRFIPSGVGDGNDRYATAATNLARNSLNQILTDQLNRLSGRYIQGVDLNFGISSNDDYTSSGITQNTQFSASVKKSFFNDRFSAQVGTSISVENNTGAVSGTDLNNLTGDIVLEYKITEDGSLRFKVFRQNQYEGLIEGSLYKTGVGLVYKRDYDKEKELFQRNKKKKKNKKSETEEKKSDE